MTAAVADNLALLSEAPGGIGRLRALILDLAANGQLLGVKDGWRESQLRELVVSSGAGWSPSCDPRPRSGGEWGVLKVSAVSWGQFRPEENKALPANLMPRPELEVQSGDFLVSRANTAELVARSVVVESTPPKLMLSDKIVRLRLSDACDPRFVQIANSAPEARRYYAAVAGGTSSSMKNVSREQILALPILLPPLAEQHRIVAKVDELMALCDRLEARQQDAEAAHARLVQALLDSLTQARDADDFMTCWQRVAGQFDRLLTRAESVDALKQVVLTLAIGGRLTDTASGDGEAAAELARHGIASKDYPRKGWAKAALGDLGSVLGGATPSKARPDFWVGPIPWVSPKDMKRPDIADAEDHVSAAALDSSALKLIPANSILMVVRGMILAHSFPVARTLVPVTMNQDMKALVPPAALVPYLLLALQALKPQIVATVDRSSHGTCKLVSEKLWSVEIGVPPLAEQHRIVAKVTELLALCDQLKARIADARSKHAQLAEALVAQAVAA